MTKATYRKKALPFLMQDFKGHCAYCLDPKEFRSPSQNQVDHFDCKLRGRSRHYYKNLMLGCAACNHYKHDKPVQNPFAADQRLFNCTEENEFLSDIVENDDGKWESKSEAGMYHLVSIGLTMQCHHNKRRARRLMADRIYSLLTTAILYKSANPLGVHTEIMNTVRDLLKLLENFPPLVTDKGVMTIKEWLAMKGIETALLAQLPDPSPAATA